MSKKCVVSFADSTGQYQRKLKRLEQSLKGNFDGDFLGFTSYQEINCEPHSEVPYKFKPMAIQKAIDLGYDEVLWADSCVYAKQSIEPVFDHIRKHGYVFFDNIGYSLGDYTNDRTLAAFDITRETAFKIKMIMACCMGFNTVTERDLLEKYKYFADEFYPGNWDNDDLTESKDMRVKGHRHDQSVMSCLIHEENLVILKGQDTFFSYESHRQVMQISDSVCLYSG
jgi:hypothetical protein